MKKTTALGGGSLFLLLSTAIASCGDNGKSDTGSMGGGGSSSSHTTTTHVAASTSTTSGGAITTSSSDSSTATGTGGSMSIRRPFLVGASLRSARALPRGDWLRRVADPVADLDGATAEMLARAWLKDALEEHASVAAFARFTMQLMAVGAPPDLLERSQRASLDEIRHAEACFALAARYGGRALGPAPLAVHDTMSALSLAEVAALTAEEGCVGETLGALLAEEQLAVATDPVVRAALKRITADEARHAELAWRFVRWAVTAGGDEVVRAVSAAVERAVEATLNEEIRSYEGIDLDAWHAHGRLTCLEARAVAERGVREVVLPCLAMALEVKAVVTAEVVSVA